MTAWIRCQHTRQLTDRTTKGLKAHSAKLAEPPAPGTQDHLPEARDVLVAQHAMVDNLLLDGFVYQLAALHKLHRKQSLARLVPEELRKRRGQTKHKYGLGEIVPTKKFLRPVDASWFRWRLVLFTKRRSKPISLISVVPRGVSNG